MNFIRELKSNEASNTLRNEGNHLYKQKKFFDALIKYNQSLCNAAHDDQLCQAYSNRSAVFFEMKLYPQCLSNISMARKHNYPDDKIQKLNEREAKCLKIFKDQPLVTQPDPFEYFKLTYKANKKIPFVIEGVEVQFDSKYGRKITAGRAIKVGDIISAESPIFRMFYTNPMNDNIDEANMYNYCHFCFNDNLLDLIPCTGCTSTMYCSHDCQSQAEKYHQYECKISSSIQNSLHIYAPMRSFFRCLSIVDGSIEELEKIFIETQNSPKNVFDFDFSNEKDPNNRRHQLKAALSFARDRSVETLYVDESFFNHHPLLRNIWKTHKIFIRKLILLLFQTARHTMAQIGRLRDAAGKPKEIGAGSYLFGALLNHSCSPNVTRFSIDDKMFLIAVRPISKGDQIFDCYTNPFIWWPLPLRQMMLAHYSFKCDCDACKDPQRYKLIYDLLIYDHEFYEYSKTVNKLKFSQMDRKAIIKVAETIKKNLQLHYDPKYFPSKEYFYASNALFECLKMLSRRNVIFGL